MKYDSSRKFLVIFSILLIGYRYFGIVIEDTIPYTQVKFPSSANFSLILIGLVLFFGCNNLYYWFRQEKKQRSYFEAIISISFGLAAIIPVFYDYLAEYGIDWKVICFSILLLVSGIFLAIAVDFSITIPFNLRSSEEMEKLGVGKMPSACKAFLRALFFLYPLNAAIILFYWYYSEKLTSPLNKYWFVIFIIPTLLINFESLFNILKLIGPKKLRENALKKLRLFRRAMDLHEMHYQYIGLEQFKDYEPTLLGQLARFGKIEEVEKLLIDGNDPNVQDKRGWTPLMWAAAEGHLNVVNLLLEHGADPNIVNYLDRTAIGYASNYGYFEIINSLIKKGANLNPSKEFMNIPPLLLAANKGHLNVVELLVENGADVLCKDKNGKDALALAMESNHGEIAKYLRNKVLEQQKETGHEKTSFLKQTSWVSGKQ